jgi:hypothetical protein
VDEIKWEADGEIKMDHTTKFSDGTKQCPGHTRIAGSAPPWVRALIIYGRGAADLNTPL